MGEKNKERKKKQSDQFRDRQTTGKTISAPTVSMQRLTDRQKSMQRTKFNFSRKLATPFRIYAQHFHLTPRTALRKIMKEDCPAFSLKKIGFICLRESWNTLSGTQLQTGAVLARTEHAIYSLCTVIFMTKL